MARGKALNGLLLVVFLVASQMVCVYGYAQTAGHGRGHSAGGVVMPPAVPDRMTFCSDVIDFSEDHMRERMDRELVAFTYGHTNSVLMVKRANRIFPQIEPLLAACGIPDDFKYLCAIESNLDPASVSSAGAAGLWQFMKDTGRAYGLEVNDNIDERYNLQKATLAACKYLLQAYEKYGDWLTVAASYNRGQGGISSSLERQNQRKATDLWLNNETSRYMFRILACKLFFDNPQDFGFYLKAEDLYPFIPAKDTVVVTSTVEDLVAFAREHGLTVAQLKRENLWLREFSLSDKSHKTYKVAIPDVKAQSYNPRKTRPHSDRWVVK